MRSRKLDDELSLENWAPIIDTCVKTGWSCPAKLALIDANSFANTMNFAAIHPTYFQLWQAAVLFFTDVSSAAELAPNGTSGNAEKLISHLKATTWNDSAVRKDVAHSLRKLRIPETFSTLGPASKLNKMRIASANQPEIDCSPRSASQQHAIIGVKACFGSFAPALWCYFSFCELRKVAPFPVNNRAVIEWSSIFNDGATFGN